MTLHKGVQYMNRSDTFNTYSATLVTPVFGVHFMSTCQPKPFGIHVEGGIFVSVCVL